MWNIPDDVLATRRDDVALNYVVGQLAEPEQFQKRVRYLYDHPLECAQDEIALKGGRTFGRYTSPLVGAGGGAVGRIWYFRDITQPKQAERALRESQQRLQRIVESAMDAIVAIDQRGIVRLFNEAAVKTFQSAAERILGDSFQRFTTKALWSALDQCMGTMDGSTSANRYIRAPDGLMARREDGTEFPIEATISEACSAGERLFTIILRDVNQQTESEKERRKLRLEKRYLEEKINGGFQDIVGRSPAMNRTMHDVSRVAGTDATVLIRGETGTGKELLARTIHEQSSRWGRMLVSVNCAALPGGLVESELFGHEKGAFTGALSRREGRFELADQGTLFLDEIGDLPLALQAKLLRVLQSGEFQRVGGVESLHADVRIVAATNCDLEGAVREGKFREDLFYRLNVFPITIPALRDRCEDIPLLANYFVSRHSAAMGKQIRSIPPETLDALMEYTWPGNVRELQNVIERAVILSDGAELRLGAWPPPAPSTGDEQQGLTLDDVQRGHIRRILEMTHWRISGQHGAARILGMKPTTLESRMKKLGITRDAG